MILEVLAQSSAIHNGHEGTPWAGNTDEGKLYVVTKLTLPANAYASPDDAWVLARFGTEVVLIRHGHVDASAPENTSVLFEEPTAAFFLKKIMETDTLLAACSPDDDQREGLEDELSALRAALGILDLRQQRMTQFQPVH